MRRRALIVDDDLAVRFVLRHALAQEGWDVEEVEDGAAVEDRLESRHYDLVILDLYMSGMNGFEVLRRIRQLHGGVMPARRTAANVRIIVLSGAAGRDGLAFAARLGADACVRKPFELADVLAAARGE